MVCSLGLPIRPPHSGSPERQRARLSDLETSIAHSGSTTSVPRMGYAIKFLELPQVVGPNKSVFWGEDLHGSSLVFFLFTPVGSIWRVLQLLLHPPKPPPHHAEALSCELLRNLRLRAVRPGGATEPKEIQVSTSCCSNMPLFVTSSEDNGRPVQGGGARSRRREEKGKHSENMLLVASCY